ncbi:hypothetical protein I5G63_gp076 [Mycobacterium phage Imvubu]|uniref:Uncharacterized protein n=1 Tax=Mycobacterium phage Imvubu TaxID=2686233 RepID=A0A6B9L7I5_9CAUD|nr:hypothetical protein I5G63_gp076 [Mycobacterium phage Imvubu]QHB37817.1 hypothetical protein PBI_IMVUBU_76 [Mycobacterium phage Imvubu]
MDIVFTTDRFSPADARVRATITEHGASASGYGPTEEAATAHLNEVIAFNLAHNGRRV